MSSSVRPLAIGLLLAAGLLSGAGAQPLRLQPLAGPGDEPPAPWQFAGLPNQTLPRTRLRTAPVDGQRALRIEADASYGNLVHPVRTSLPAGARLAWRWRVDQPQAQADLSRKDGDDTAVKVCLLFDLPLAAVPFVERQLLRLARNRTGEMLPAATVCYVWDARQPAGTALDNPYTRRVRTLVLRGPESPRQAWAAEQRDVAADFLRLFGDEAGGRVPPLLAVAVGADGDNTGGRSLAWVDALTLD